MAILTVPFGHTVNGIVVSNGDIQDVYGKTVDETIELGGIQNVYGKDTGSIVRPDGVQYVYGVSTKETIEFGGTQYVYGKDIDLTILGSNAVQHVYGIAVRTTVNHQQIVEAGGFAIDATLNSLGIDINNYGGADQLVNSGGTAIGTVINIFAYEFVLNDGLALNSTVNSGGYLVVAGGGTLEGRTQINGGEVVLLGTAATVGSIIFSGPNGRIDIGGDASNFHATIYKFVPGDIIDLNGITFGPNTKLIYHSSLDENAGTLTVTDGTTTEQIKLVGHYTQADFAIAQSPHGDAFSGGTIVTDLASQGHSGSDIFHWL